MSKILGKCGECGHVGYFENEIDGWYICPVCVTEVHLEEMREIDEPADC